MTMVQTTATVSRPLTPPKSKMDFAPSQDYLNSISRSVDHLSADLRKISLTIHENPELNYKEFIAHETLTSYLEGQPGWTVKRSLYGIDTSFLAIYRNKGGGSRVSFNAEYDALPEIGHACGHNLIAISSLAAAIATAAALREFDMAGTIYLVGTPAEDGGGGKIRLIEAGLYRDNPIEISLMAHPANSDVALGRSTAMTLFKVEYSGKAAHAAMCPEQGINALDAMISGYNHLSLLRQQTSPGDVISGYITDGGSAVNIIPDYTSAAFATRAPTRQQLGKLNKRVKACFDAGAVGSGATVKITGERGYDDHVPNRVLGALYRKWFNVLDGNIPDAKEDLENGLLPASTDQGNVSYVVPSLHVLFKIESTCRMHQKGFADAAKSETSHLAALRVAKALSLTAFEVLTDQGILPEVRQDFLQHTENSV